MPDRPTALVTTDETMTLGAIDAILDAGLEIPGDISLVAFDDLPWTTLIRPPLTVVAQPVHELGVTATQRLLGRLAGFDGPPETVVLRTAFVVRGSTGPAPNGPAPQGRVAPVRSRIVERRGLILPAGDGRRRANDRELYLRARLSPMERAMRTHPEPATPSRARPR